MIAKTILDLPETEDMKTILDRSKPIQPIIDKMVKQWNYDLYSRKPGPAYEDGVFVGTDLDMACFIYALADRGAVINLPSYSGRRPRSIKEGEIVVSASNRHGKITGLSANKEVFSFSVKIFDQNVITSESTGAFRNFMLVDVDGTWHEGWKTIEFLPSAKENDFLTKNELWTGNNVIFKDFIHPNRWISFYGQYYLLTKALISRLEEESKYYFAIIKDLKSKIPDQEQETKEHGESVMVGEKKTIEVDAFQAELDIPAFIGNFSEVEGKDDSEKFQNATKTRNEYIYTLIPKLRFPLRATEFAFFQHGENGNKKPSWMNGTLWDRNFKIKRTVWNRLDLTNGMALRYRTYKKSETVAAD